MKEFEKDIALHHAEYYASANHCAADKPSIIAAYQRGWLDGLENQWISVDEELPKDNKTVVLINSADTDDCAVGWFDYPTNKWWIYWAEGGSPCPFKVTHWMEIPTLEGGEE